MSQITLFTNPDGFSMYIDAATGEVFTTNGTLAKLCGVDEKAIKYRLNRGGEIIDLKNAEILTATGKQGGGNN